MKQVLAVCLVFAASPALAHHEVIMVTTMMPLAAGLAAIASATIVAWTQRGKKPPSPAKKRALLGKQTPIR